MFQDLFKRKSPTGPQAGNPAFDPFCKTSFDALLESLDGVDPSAGGELSPEDAKAFENTFPGFQAEGAPFQTGQQAQPAQMQLLQQRQMRTQGMQGIASSFAASTVISSPPAAPSNSRLSLDSYMLRQGVAAAPVNAFNKRPSDSGLMDDFSASGSGAATQSVYEIIQSGPSAKDAFHSAILGFDGAPNKRVSSSGRMSPLARSPSPSGSLCKSRLSDPDGGSDSSVWHRGRDVSPELPPRVSLESLGVLMKSSDLQGHGSFDSGGGYSSGGGASGKGRSTEGRREKNRVAQRRFRERQKQTVATLTAELDAKDEATKRLLSQIRMLELTNNTLTATLLEYERIYGPLPSQQQAGRA